MYYVVNSIYNPSVSSPDGELFSRHKNNHPILSDGKW